MNTRTGTVAAPTILTVTGTRQEIAEFTATARGSGRLVSMTAPRPAPGDRFTVSASLAPTANTRPAPMVPHSTCAPRPATVVRERWRPRRRTVVVVSVASAAAVVAVAGAVYLVTVLVDFLQTALPTLLGAGFVALLLLLAFGGRAAKRHCPGCD